MSQFTRRILLLVSVTVFSAVAAGAQSPSASSKAPATIAGRVTLDGAGAPGAQVMLKPHINDGVTRISFGNEQPPALGGATDAEGRYRLTDVPPGAYRISVFAPAYAVDGESDPLTPGKTVNVAEGENVENADFTLTRGSVITGKVTDDKDRPVIDAPINAYQLDANGKQKPLGPLSSAFLLWFTDDRGVYRIFGLEAGRYLVAAGFGSIGGGTGGGYRTTFHPDAVEEAQARIIEVKSGEEAANIDIKVASPVKGYAVAGRVVEADTDNPVPGVTVNYNAIGRGMSMSAVGAHSAVTNALGEFRFENVPPNGYRAFIVNINTPGRGASTLGDEIKFDVVAGDVSGLELRAPRGASISGVVAIEGSNDPALRAKLAQVSLIVRSDSRPAMIGGLPGGNGTISQNGTFKLSNVQPGKTRIVTGVNSPKGLALARVEQNGVEVNEFNVNAGDQITGVRLVFSYGAGVIAGRIEVKGGSLPAGARLGVSYRPEGGRVRGQPTKSVEVDGRGQFVIEGLAQGTYKLFFGIIPAGARMNDVHRVEQIVTVAGEGRHEVTLVVDLTRKEGEK